MNVPARSSSNASCSSALLFITIGPYQATGSLIGLPDTEGSGCPVRRPERLSRGRSRTARASDFRSARHQCFADGVGFFRQHAEWL